MTNFHVDALALKLACCGLFFLLMAAVLKRTRWTGQIAHLAAIRSVYRSGSSGSISRYARLPFITTQQGGTCPLLRSILVDDLGCRDITEVSGGGDTWWDFNYKRKRFTCKIQPKSSHGSQLYRTGAGLPAEDEDELLQQLAHRIAWNAAIKTGLTCHGDLCQ